MIFKTAVVLTFSTLPAVQEELLQAYSFFPCKKQDITSGGFVNPDGFDCLVGVSTDKSLCVVCLQVEEKILPSAVVNRAVSDRVAEITRNEERTPGRKERQEIKEEVTFTLTPQAFSKYRKTHAIIDHKNHLILVNGGFTRAEEISNMLRSALGSLPAALITTKLSPSVVMTEWLKSGLPTGVLAGDYCKLEEPNDNGAIHISRNDDPEGELIGKYIDAGRAVVELGLFLDPLSFVLTQSLNLKGIKFTDIAIDTALDGAEDQHQAAQANLILYSDAISAVVKLISAAFGGREQPDLDLKPCDTSPSPSPASDIETTSDDDSSSYQDPLYDQAKDYVIASGRASISAIQRHLQVGYNRAARFMERLEEERIVSPVNNLGGRAVLVAEGGATA